MSRSVSIPINLSPSTIGARPTSSSRIISAAYATDFSASMVHGLEVMTSRMLCVISPPVRIRITRCVPRVIPYETVKIQHVSYGQRIRDLALSFPETYEDSPWGHPVFKVGDNKMFAAMSDGADPVTLTVKLTPEEREIALHIPYVSVARYVGRYGWVTAEVSDEESLENALEWLRESYWLKAPARLRSAVEET